MRIFRTHNAPILPALLLVIAASVPAWAQERTATPDPARSGHLVVEQMKSGFVIAPDARFTDVNDDFAALAGVYGGWALERTLLIGGGGYWLANRSDDFKMAYGGPVVEWLVHGDRNFGFGARGLIGVGNATISGSLNELFDVPLTGNVPPGSRRTDRILRGTGRAGRGVSGATIVAVKEDYFVAEPQGTVFWQLAPWLRIDAGVGYRLIGAAGGLDDRLRGVSGSVSVQLFGGGA
jgi:hypothetical protein